MKKFSQSRPGRPSATSFSSVCRNSFCGSERWAFAAALFSLTFSSIFLGPFREQFALPLHNFRPRGMSRGPIRPPAGRRPAANPSDRAAAGEIQLVANLISRSTVGERRPDPSWTGRSARRDDRQASGPRVCSIFSGQGWFSPGLERRPPIGVPCAGPARPDFPRQSPAKRKRLPSKRGQLAQRRGGGNFPNPVCDSNHFLAKAFFDAAANRKACSAGRDSRRFQQGSQSAMAASCACSAA